jgi:hypothetical protein
VEEELPGFAVPLPDVVPEEELPVVPPLVLVPVEPLVVPVLGFPGEGVPVPEGNVGVTFVPGVVAVEVPVWVPCAFVMLPLVSVLLFPALAGGVAIRTSPGPGFTPMVGVNVPGIGGVGAGVAVGRGVGDATCAQAVMERTLAAIGMAILGEIRVFMKRWGWGP